MAEAGDVGGGEMVGGEDVVAPFVEAVPCVGEVALVHAGVQAAGEGDNLGGGVPVEGGGDVDVVAGFGAAGFSELKLAWLASSD